jgi:hypothetical protein
MKNREKKKKKKKRGEACGKETSKTCVDLLFF